MGTHTAMECVLLQFDRGGSSSGLCLIHSHRLQYNIFKINFNFELFHTHVHKMFERCCATSLNSCRYNGTSLEIFISSKTKYLKKLSCRTSSNCLFLHSVLKVQNYQVRQRPLPCVYLHLIRSKILALSSSMLGT